jgi:DNA-binding NarL/FixJ family response regulator
MRTEPMIRVVLADDNVIVREGVRTLLSVWGDVDMVPSAQRIEPAWVKGCQTRVGAYLMGSASP